MSGWVLIVPKWSGTDSTSGWVVVQVFTDSVSGRVLIV